MIDQILKNQSDYLEISISYEGVLTDAENVKIATITDANDQVIASNITATAGSSTGLFKCLIDSAYTAEIGSYTAVWSFDIGNNTLTHIQQFEVVLSLGTDYVTLTDIRNKSTLTSITSSEPSDDVLEKLIAKSTQIINSYVGGSLFMSEKTEKVRCILNKQYDGFMIKLSSRPIISVSSISLIFFDMNAPRVFDVTKNMRIHENTGVIDLYACPGNQLLACRSSHFIQNNVPIAEVTYTSGLETIPDDLQYAAILIVENLYKESLGTVSGELSSVTIGEYKESYATSEKRIDADARRAVGGSDWDTIKKILTKYRQSSESAGIAGTLG